MAIKTLPSNDGTHKWQVRVNETRRGFTGAFRDDSMGKWSGWKQVFHGHTGRWEGGTEAMADMIRFVTQ